MESAGIGLPQIFWRVDADRSNAFFDVGRFVQFFNVFFVQNYLLRFPKTFDILISEREVSNMNITMEQKIKKFFDSEYVGAKEYINYFYGDDLKLKSRSIGIEMIIEKTICRLLGVTQFVQGLGVEYKEIAPIYDEYREKLEKLLESEGK